MARYSRILVLCPHKPRTAGPEALHQLVSRLNALGQPAAIVYHPFDAASQTPAPYQHHQAPVATYADEPGTLLLFPEVFPMLALRPRKAAVALWWMSVNNFTGQRYRSRFVDRLRYAVDVVRGERPLGGTRSVAHLLHFAQSDHAARFLQARGIASLPLSDPIPGYTEAGYLAWLDGQLQGARRGDTILYNPVKGAYLSRRLIAAFPQWRFQPLQNLDRAQLAQAFLQSKLYMDFGHHPGKDRLPREAALHGCCVVCARHGSAASPIDVPIAQRYKLDVHDRDFIRQFGQLAGDILERHAFHAPQFDGYRDIIRQEPLAFDQQIRAAFLDGGATPEPRTATSAHTPAAR